MVDHTRYESGLCLACFAHLEGASTCSACGFQGDGEREVTEDELAPGTLLRERYQVGRVLGRGGFGITYLGFDQSLRRRRAIKEYFPRGILTRSPTSTRVTVYSGQRDLYKRGMEAYLSEAQLLAQFERHPCIVSPLDFFEENGTAYLVMEYLEGETLRHYVERNGGRLRLEHALYFMLPVLEALRSVHEAGITHRDVSPDNVFLTTHSQSKLIDFGAARQGLAARAGPATVIVRDHYAPPEQYAREGRQGPWTDIYAAAATFYHALTGVSPPTGPERMLNDELETPTALGVKISREAERALMRALSLRPEERPQDVEWLRTRLEASLRAGARLVDPRDADGGEPEPLPARPESPPLAARFSESAQQANAALQSAARSLVSRSVGAVRGLGAGVSRGTRLIVRGIRDLALGVAVSLRTAVLAVVRPIRNAGAWIAGGVRAIPARAVLTVFGALAGLAMVGGIGWWVAQLPPSAPAAPSETRNVAMGPESGGPSQPIPEERIEEKAPREEEAPSPLVRGFPGGPALEPDVEDSSAAAESAGAPEVDGLGDELRGGPAPSPELPDSPLPIDEDRFAGVAPPGEVPEPILSDEPSVEVPEPETQPAEEPAREEPAAPEPALVTAIVVRSNVIGDQLEIDGQIVGSTGPTVHVLSPGTHVFRVRKDGYVTAERRLVLTPGSAPVQIRMLLRREDAPETERFDQAVAQLGDADPDTRREGVAEIEKLAQAGLTPAQAYLGGLYARGDYVEAPSDALALSWHREAAKGGDARAQYALATRLEYGSWDPFETTPEANESPGLFGRLLGFFGSQPTEKERKAFIENLENGKGDEFGGPPVEGEERDFPEAFEWYSLAGENGGIAEAQERAGFMKASGRGTERNVITAFRKWFMLAAPNEMRNSQYVVGMCYLLSIGIAEKPENRSTAECWLRRAAAQGQTDARAQLEQLDLDPDAPPPSASCRTDYLP